MRARRRVGTPQRRARLVARHHLHRTAGGVEAAARDVVALHSSDPATPYLSLWARVAGFEVADLDRALYEDRTLWRLHAMRRTLFVVPTDRAPVLQTACGRDIARAERRKLERWVAQALDDEEPRAWLRAVEERTLATLADGRPRSTRELTPLVEGLSLRLTVGSGAWASATPLSSRLLFLAAMEGHIVRARPSGSWLSSQYRWADARSWFAARPPAGTETSDDPAAARARLARWWLHANGPGTTTDLRWWTGWTVRDTHAALTAVAAAEVDLDGTAPGWLLPEDEDVQAATPPGAALLPALDPTVMGWKERDWYLAGHAALLFDRNGNAGPTIWVDGRVVGGWAQRPGGEVVTRILEDVGAEATELVAAEAAALTTWAAGTACVPRFPSPLGTELSR